MKTLQWGKGRATHKASAAGSLDKAGRISRQINWRLSHDRCKAATAAREAHLRELMGLPAQRSTMSARDGEG
jgi:hypothetical protein